MPQPPTVPRPHDSALRRPFDRFHLARVVQLLALALALVLPAAPVSAAPSLSLPTPPGEAWKVIQGYGCGSHNSWDRYSLDMVRVEGATFGAPVAAAADGTIWSWTAKSGTLILAHGDGFYTMYTHLDRAVSTQMDRAVKRGEVIGYAGDRASHGLAHLHFTAFTGKGLAASGRKSVPLSFADGFDLPDIGGCNQHGGEVLVAGGMPSGGVRFASAAQPGRWYAADQRVEFYLPAGARGFSQAWDQQPADAPQFADARDGYVETAWAGEGLHTLHIRYWDAAGKPGDASFGPFGYDLTPPDAPAALGEVALGSGQGTTLQWAPAADNGAGVAGYRVYLGSDPNGSANTLVPSPAFTLPALAAGSYLLRVQSLDYAGNAGAWATIARITVAAR